MKIKLLAATGMASIVVCFGAQAALAQSTEADGGGGNEIIVTANRRAEDVSKIPYNISAIGGEAVERAGIANFEDLARSVPNLNLNSAGSRSINAHRPVIRGLNASASNRQGEALEQPAVATYLGNVAVPAGLFPIDDIERIEVLRGPQGTLYGAGALGGAIRIIPAAPRLGEFEGSVTGSAALVSHSKDLDYSIGGVINVPVGETLALRVSAQHQRNAGFIDRYGIFEKQGDFKSPPVLANPGDVVGSSAVLKDKRDSNWDRADSVRAAIKWEPTDDIDLVAAYGYSRFRGEGGPEDNIVYQGGPDPLDPDLSYPALGKYKVIKRADEPFNRQSHLGSLDASFDAGFATLSSTTSYTTSKGQNVSDGTYTYLRLVPSLRSYYVGNPVNPRFYGVSDYRDKSKVFTQEFRVVSQLDGPIEFVVGVYYQREKRDDVRGTYLPGTPEQTAAAGNPIDPFNLLGDDDRVINFASKSKFVDKAFFGELTWKITDEWQITGGARVFKQTFNRSIDFAVPLFGIAIPNPDDAGRNATSVKDAIFKLNTSYEFSPGHQFYATFSQGFRRGGANNFALGGIAAEPASILLYKPDYVDNYEAGVKGKFGGLRYTFDVFYDDWTNPQIGLSTPKNVWPVVVNGKKARSKGIEFELGGSITPELDFSIGYAYADAKITRDFCIPTGDGFFGFIDCGIQGVKGTRLPGAPKHTGSASLDYERELASGDKIGLSVNANYKGSLYTTLPGDGLFNPKLDSFWTVGASASWTHGPIQASLFARNLFNERGVLGVNNAPGASLDGLDAITQITRPRTIGIQLRFNW
jgi:outer membrane receptor protein involved in Fe transport